MRDQSSIFEAMIEITPYGAAGEVTGSAYLLRFEQTSVLVDFGLFQGDKEDDARNVVPGEIHRNHPHAVLLTHAHLDHCGRLPLLVEGGYRGPIYATDATRDLAELVLMDAAHIQESDYERRKKRAQKQGRKLQRTDLPLFDTGDVEQTLELFSVVEYNTPIDVAPGVTAIYHEAGHMLGSASIEVICSSNGNVCGRVLFSGDLGPPQLPFLRDPEPPSGPFDVVVMESTYGDREHRPLDETMEQFAAILVEAVSSKGKIFIPSFAIGRSQNILYYIAELVRTKRIPRIPIYLDSPMAIKASHLYADHHDLFDEESTELVESGSLRDNLRTVRFTETAEESKALNTKEGPFVVIAGAGMCNAGRILHHLRNNISDPTAHVIITGYQAYGTLGRKLVDGLENVSIMGDYKPVRAQIHTLGGMSAHADKPHLLKWLGSVLTSAPSASTHVVLTHGEDEARDALGESIAEQYSIQTVLPYNGITLELP